MFQNLPPGGTKVKKLDKANVSEMPKKAPSIRILRHVVGNTAFSDRDHII